MTVHRLQSFRWRVGASLVASACSAISLFATFRVATSLISVSAIGCWALLQGLFLISRVVDSGAGANVTRYVAVRSSESEASSPARIAVAAGFVTGLPVASIGCILYFPVVLFVQHRFSSEINPSAIRHLAFASLVYAVVSSLATVVLAAYEGTGAIVQKNAIAAVSSVVALGSTYPLIYYYGLPGIGLSYLSGAFTQLILGLAVLLGFAGRRNGSKGAGSGEPNVPLFLVARCLWKENSQLGLVALMRLSFEPTTKLILSAVASLPAIAAFELALRFSAQIRAFLQAIVSPMLIIGARSGIAASQSISEKFRAVNRLVSGMSLALLEVQLLASPLISQAGLGSVSATFLVFFGLLAFSGAINGAGLVGYYFQLSSGGFRPIIRIHIVMATINVLLGLTGGIAFGGLGVVLAYAFTFAYGGIASARLALPALGTTMRKNLLSSCEAWPAFRIVLAVAACSAYPLLISTLGTSRAYLASLALTVGAIVAFARSSSLQMLRRPTW